MNRFASSGFTIIETLLYLGITSVLMAGVMMGTGGVINNQRYRDSVTSLQSFLQKQYIDVSNVDNSTNGNTCGGTALVARGQSDCVVLGRYITSNPADHTTLIVKRVIGRVPSVSSTGLTDAQIFAFLTTQGGYNAVVDPNVIATTNYDLEWGSEMHSDTSTGAGLLNFSLLILRSPETGVVRTFINNNSIIPDNQIKSNLISQAALTVPLKICLNASSYYSGPKSAVLVNANAAATSAIETLGSGSSGC